MNGATDRPTSFAGHLSLRYSFLLLAIAALYCPYISYRYRLLSPEGRPIFLVWLGVALALATTSFIWQLWNVARQRSKVPLAGDRIATSLTKVGGKSVMWLLILLVPSSLGCVLIIIESATPALGSGPSFLKTYNLFIFSVATGMNLVTMPMLFQSANTSVTLHEHGLVGLGFANWKWYRSYRIESGAARTTLHLKPKYNLFAQRIELASDDVPAIIAVLERNGIASKR